MNTPRDDGGPAFPVPYVPGMTLRDYLAAKAMHQFMKGAVLPPGFDATEQLKTVASRAYEVADAMLRARSA